MPHIELSAPAETGAASSTVLAATVSEAENATGDHHNRLMAAWSETVTETALGFIEAGRAVGLVCGVVNGAYAWAATDACTRISVLSRRAADRPSSERLSELETEGATLLSHMASTYGRLQANACVSLCTAMSPGILRASTASGRFVRSLSE